MKTSSKVILATAVAAVLGSTLVVGTSFADRGEHGRGYDDDSRDNYGERHHGRRMGERGHGRHSGERGHKRRGFGRGGMQMLANLDSDGDGKLTQEEVNKTRGERFAKFDSDADGNLNLQEYQALWLDAMHSRMVDRFQDLDDDGDAVITDAEFQRPFDNMVSRLDRDDDGEVSGDEMQQRRRRGK